MLKGSFVPPLTPDLLGEIVTRILAVGAPHRIVLFGSRARGDARSDSDLDLFIVEDSHLPRYRRPPRYLRALLGVFPAKDVACGRQPRWRAWRDVPHALITTALREGRTLGPFDAVCVHAQQACKKALKAVLASAGTEREAANAIVSKK